MVFCDTSGLYAVANASDPNHGRAVAAWQALVGGDRPRLMTTNYVMLETWVLVQARHGIRAAEKLAHSIEPAVDIAFVDESLHRAAVEACLRSARRKVSLVDCVSFAFMQRHGIRTALAFDRHFEERGFELVGG